LSREFSHLTVAVLVYDLDPIVSELANQRIERAATANDQAIELRLRPFRRDLMHERNEEAQQEMMEMFDRARAVLHGDVAPISDSHRSR
jgi:nitrate reductase assembly molybdenum cofactor insertion protein NarJ